MTMPLVALCADEESVRHPELLGLVGESLSAQGWLRLFTSADMARRSLACDARIREAWVASSDPVAPINLAAALKHDRPDLRVCMLAANDSGSLRSRASAAGIDATLTPKLFSQRYAQYKQLSAQQSPSLGGAAAPTSSYPAAADGSVSNFAAGASDAGFGAAGAAREASCAGTSGAFPQGATGFAAAGPAGFGVGCGVGSPVAPFGGAAEQSCARDSHLSQLAGADGREALLPSSGFGQAAGPDASRLPAQMGSTCGAPSGYGGPRGVDSPSDKAVATQAPRPGQATASRGFLLPVISGSGGCGKSSVAVLSALLLKAAGLNTLLLDFDLQFGDMAEMLGVERPLRIDEALAQPSRIDSLQAQGNLPALLAAPLRVELAESIANQAGGLIDELRGRFDVVVANTGSAWAEQHAVLLERSSKALFLIDQRQTSLRASARALELCSRCGIAVNPFVFALNGCGKGAPISVLDASNALRGAHVHELADGGLEVEELLAGACGLELIESGNDLVEGLSGLLAEILPAEMGAKLHAEDEQTSGLGLFRGNKKPRRRKR